MPDGKKSGKVRKFLRVLRGITKLGRFAPGPIGLVMGLISEGVVAAEAINGPGTGAEKKKKVTATADRIIKALESEGLFTVPADLKDGLSEIIDGVVADQNAIGVLPKDGEAVEESVGFRKGMATPVVIRGTMEPQV